MREAGKEITHITSIGGGAKVNFGFKCKRYFNASIRKLKHEEGPSMGRNDCGVWVTMV